MTETQWLRCTDPWKMLIELSFVGQTHRKSRLFCCAYCRCFFWDYLSTGLRDAIEIAEAYADQRASKYKLRKAQNAFQHVGKITNAEWRANLVVQLAVSPSNPFRSACMLLQNRNTLPWRGNKKAIASLLRDIFGYPFGPAIPIEDSIFAWSNGTVPKLAQSIYDDGAFDRVPILADALEDAGCTREDILNHCRSGDQHTKGCWVVDLLLEKQ